METKQRKPPGNGDESEDVTIKKVIVTNYVCSLIQKKNYKFKCNNCYSTKTDVLQFFMNLVCITWM